MGRKRKKVFTRVGRAARGKASPAEAQRPSLLRSLSPYNPPALLFHEAPPFLCCKIPVICFICHLLP